MSNHTFVDSQNLYMNAKANSWAVDLARFRTYLKEHYNAKKAYYFIGTISEITSKIADKKI